jgi:hypothetical protein
MRSLLLVLAVSVSIGVAHADVAIIDYQGYAWETAGFPPSNAGDMFNLVGVVDAIDPIFGINLLVDEVTLWVTDLVSGGQVDIGGGVLSISYIGGTIELYQDPGQDHDYGVNPPNATAPSSFTNGTLFLGGTFTNFFLFFDPSTGSGAYEGNVVFNAGSGLATLNQLNADGYTFGGVLNNNAAGGNVPQGYDLQVDGTLEVEVQIGVEDKTWSGIKDMYRR